MPYTFLGQQNKRIIRAIARESYIDADGDVEGAIAIGRDKLTRRVLGSIVGTFLMGLAIKLLVELIKYWAINHFKRPPFGGFIKGEPGA